MTVTNLSRRHVLGGALALGGLSLLPGAALAATSERRLAFRNVHNNERVDARYFIDGQYDWEGLSEINHGLRDWRTGDMVEMDRDLIDLLALLRDQLDISPRRPFDLISGYRSPRTNSMLREHGGGGVATKSQHLLGRATDVALPGVPLERLRQAALAAQRGGVGYYPRSGFVHIDTGRVRSW